MSAYKPLLLWVWLFFSACQAYGQSVPQLLLAKADSLLRQDELAKALEAYLEAELYLGKSDGREEHLVEVYAGLYRLYEQKAVYPKMKEYALKEVQAAKKVGLPLSTRLQKLGLSFLLTDLKGKAIETYREAAAQSIEEGLSPHVSAEIYSQLSYLQQENGRLKAARISAVQAFEKYCLAQDTLALCASYNNLGFLERREGRLESAQIHFKQAENLLKLYRSGKEGISDEQASLEINQGVVLYNLGESGKAMSYFKSALSHWLGQNNFFEAANTQIFIAKQYIANLQLEKAINVLKDCLENAEKSDNNKARLKALGLLVEAYEKNGEYQNAANAKSSFNRSKDSLADVRLQSKQEKLELQVEAERDESAFKLLFAEKQRQSLMLRQLKAESEKQEQALALQAQKVQLLQKEQALSSAETERLRLREEQERQNLVISQQKLQDEIKKREIMALQRNKELQDLALEKEKLLSTEKEKEIALLERTKQAQAKQLESERTIRYFSIGFTVLAILTVLYVLYSFYRQRKLNKVLKEQSDTIIENNRELKTREEELQQNMEELQAIQTSLIAQNRLIEKKNKDITASINYAERIQGAILKPEKKLTEFLSGAFVYFVPKDVLSGDFYWFKQLNEHQFMVAVSDCTGHGVPGAIMTMIGSSVLHEVYNGNNMVMPDKALSVLDNKLYEMFDLANNTGINDGMDIALIGIDKKENKLFYSGAKSPVYRVKNGAVSKIKASKYPIGGGFYKNKKVFDLEVFPLEKGAKYYLASDGFQDQFDKDDKKKYTSRRMLRLLEGIHTLSFAEQKKRFAQEFQEWKGDNRQFDDVLVMGFEV